MKRLIEEARRILRMGSVSDEGNEELSNYVAILMQAIGLKVQTQTIVHSLDRISKKQVNVIGTLGDSLVDRKTRTGLLFVSALDTPSPGRKEAWTETGGDPFLAEVKNDTIYGLGSAHSKLDLLCKLYALQEFRERKLKMPIYLTGVCGEDIHLLGAHYLLQSKALNPKFVLNGRPTNLKLVHKHPASQSFRIQLGYKVFPKGAHGFNRKIHLKSIGRTSSVFFAQNGVHAIRNLLRFLEQASFSGFQIQCVHFSGGTPSNQVPDSAECELYITSHQLEDFKRFFREHGAGLHLTLGGLGDSGVAFLPESLLECLKALDKLFQELQDDPTSRCDIHWTFVHQNPSRTELGVTLVYKQGAHPDEVRQLWMERITLGLRPYSLLTSTILRQKPCPPLDMSPEQEWVGHCLHAAKSASIDSELVESKVTGSAGLFFASGYPALVFGPGSEEDNSGSPNEHVPTAQLEKAIGFYTSLIERTCL